MSSPLVRHYIFHSLSVGGGRGRGVCAFYRPFNNTSVTSSWIPRNTKGVSKVSNPLVPRGFLYDSYKKKIKLSPDRAGSPEIDLAHYIKR